MSFSQYGQAAIVIPIYKEESETKITWSILIDFSANLDFLIKVIYNTFLKEVKVYPFSIPDNLMGPTFF